MYLNIILFFYIIILILLNFPQALINFTYFCLEKTNFLKLKYTNNANLKNLQ